MAMSRLRTQKNRFRMKKFVAHSAYARDWRIAGPRWTCPRWNAVLQHFLQRVHYFVGCFSKGTHEQGFLLDNRCCLPVSHLGDADLCRAGGASGANLVG